MFSAFRIFERKLHKRQDYEKENLRPTRHNPLSFIDPDGRAPEDIIIKVRDDDGETFLTLDYKNDGKLYDVSGKLYEGDNSIARGIQGAINEARSSDERLDAMFGELETSNKEHEWTNNNPKADTKYSDNRSSSKGTITQFAPEENMKLAVSRGRTAPTASDIATHEGKHAYDRDKGKLRSRNPSGPGANGVSDAEVDGINAERLNQAGQNRPLRTSFGRQEIDPSRLTDPKNKNYTPLHKKQD